METGQKIKKTVRVKFVDFGPDWDYENNLFVQMMARQFDVRLVEENPNYLFHGLYGGRAYEGIEHFFYRAPDCVKIFYTAENVVPDFNTTDYALGFAYLDFGDRYLRFPIHHLGMMAWKPEENWRPLGRAEALERPGFCNFVYSNAQFAAPERDAFFHLLSRYRKVDSAGRHLRNTDALARIEAEGGHGGWAKAKRAFLAGYKFTIAFENDSFPGYTTEKIFDAFAARTVPIYWGNPRVAEEFAPGSFVNAHDFDSLEALVREVERLDNDDDAYMEMINTNPFAPLLAGGNQVLERFDRFIRNIMEPPPEQARRRGRHAAACLLEDDREKRARELLRRRWWRDGLRFWKR